MFLHLSISPSPYVSIYRNSVFRYSIFRSITANFSICQNQSRLSNHAPTTTPSPSCNYPQAPITSPLLTIPTIWQVDMSFCGITVSFNGTAEQIFVRLPAAMGAFSHWDNNTNPLTTKNMTSSPPSIRVKAVHSFAEAEAEAKKFREEEGGGGGEGEDEKAYVPKIEIDKPTTKEDPDPFEGLGIGERLGKCKKGELPFAGV